VPFDPALRKTLLAFLGLLATGCLPALAEDRAGDFDFYVLALSWSPTYCTLENQPDDAQCGVEEHGFILHGLWPQYESGYPEYCRSAMSDRISNATIRSIFEIMPSAGLARYQWRKHGICTGLRQDAYFALARDAFRKIKVPAQFIDPPEDATRAPLDIERAFIAANPGLQSNAISVACKNRHLSDVRICLSKDLQFRACPEVDADYCRTKQISVPAIQ
jgi:ribonuclease T2